MIVPWGGRVIQHSAARPPPSNGRDLARLSRMLRCPRCDSQYVRISCSKKILDNIFWWFLNKVPFRCCLCRLRFYRRYPEESTVIR